MLNLGVVNCCACLFQLNSLTVQVGLPDSMLHESYVNQFYKQLQTQKLDFFLNINHAVTYVTDNLQKLLRSNKEELGWVERVGKPGGKAGALTCALSL